MIEECQLNLKNRQNYQAVYQTNVVAQNNNAGNNERNNNNDRNDRINYQRYEDHIYKRRMTTITDVEYFKVEADTSEIEKIDHVDPSSATHA